MRKMTKLRQKLQLVTLTSSARYAITTPFSWPFSVLLEKCLKFFCLVLLRSNYFHVKKSVYSMPCVPNPHPTPQNSHTHRYCYNYGPCLTLKSILHSFLKLLHCMTLTITLGPGEGSVATNQYIIIINCWEIVRIENVICLSMWFLAHRVFLVVYLKSFHFKSASVQSS